MKDYMGAEERNQLLVFMSIIQLMQGSRSITNQKIKPMLEDWASRNNLTKEEHKYLKTAETYMDKFCKSVYSRMGEKEKEQIDKRILKFDFRLVDEYTLQKVYRDINERMKIAAVPRQQFESWCSEIMDIKCNGCNGNWKDCELHKIFEDNFVPESTWGLENCRYAYAPQKTKAV